MSYIIFCAFMMLVIIVSKIVKNDEVIRFGIPIAIIMSIFHEAGLSNPKDIYIIVLLILPSLYRSIKYKEKAIERALGRFFVPTIFLIAITLGATRYSSKEWFLINSEKEIFLSTYDSSYLIIALVVFTITMVLELRPEVKGNDRWD